MSKSRLLPVLTAFNWAGPLFLSVALMLDSPASAQSAEPLDPEKDAAAILQFKADLMDLHARLQTEIAALQKFAE